MPRNEEPGFAELWLGRALAAGYSTAQMASQLGTTPAALRQLMASVPTSTADLRRLARKLGVDYESLRGFTDDALQPITGFDADTQKVLRLWQKLDAPRRVTALALLGDMARASTPKRRSRRPASTKASASRGK